jgi:hypothetical protein
MILSRLLLSLEWYRLCAPLGVCSSVLPGYRSYSGCLEVLGFTPVQTFSPHVEEDIESLGGEMSISWWC